VLGNGVSSLTCHASRFQRCILSNIMLFIHRIIFLLISIIILLIWLSTTHLPVLLSILLEGPPGDAIRRTEVPLEGPALDRNQTFLIPKIIHQTYANSSIPKTWAEAQQSCIDLHPDYEYKVRGGPRNSMKRLTKCVPY